MGTYIGYPDDAPTEVGCELRYQPTHCASKRPERRSICYPRIKITKPQTLQRSLGRLQPRGPATIWRGADQVQSRSITVRERTRFIHAARCSDNGAQL